MVKRSARVPAVWGLRIDTLSRRVEALRGGTNTDLHSDCSGKGGRLDKGVSFEMGVEEVE